MTKYWLTLSAGRISQHEDASLHDIYYESMKKETKSCLRKRGDLQR